MQDVDIDLGPYRVVLNHEEQYSILPISQPVPAGWRPADCEGAEEVCLAHIREVWTDMRPLSARVTAAS